jgi:uncharacterized protein involved in cysteine biosynthesis
MVPDSTAGRAPPSRVAPGRGAPAAARPPPPPPPPGRGPRPGRLSPLPPSAPPAAGDPPGARGLLPGLGSFLRGAAFAARRPALWPWILLPAAANAALLVLLLGCAWTLAPDLVPTMDAPWHPALEWSREALRGGARLFARVVGALLALGLSLALVGVVNAPFYEVLSHRTERAAAGDAAAGDAAPPSNLLRALRASLLLLAVEAAVLLPLALLALFTPLAPAVAVAGAWFCGLSLSDAALARRGLGGRARLRWARERWGLVLGLGLPVYLFPPGAPFGVVGAALRVPLTLSGATPRPRG